MTSLARSRGGSGFGGAEKAKGTIATQYLLSPQTFPRFRQESSEEDEDSGTEYTRQNRHVAGKTFYWNGKRWIDATTRSLKDARPIRIKFASDEYFALYTKEPAVAKWLALGRNITFTLDGELYEIHD